MTLSQEFYEKHGIDWHTPTESLHSVYRFPCTCRKCKKGFITKWDSLIRDYHTVSRIFGEYCSNAMCDHNVKTTQGSYF